MDEPTSLCFVFHAIFGYVICFFARSSHSTQSLAIPRTILATSSTRALYFSTYHHPQNRRQSGRARTDVEVFIPLHLLFSSCSVYPCFSMSAYEDERIVRIWILLTLIMRLLKHIQSHVYFVYIRKRNVEGFRKRWTTGNLKQYHLLVLFVYFFRLISF